MIDQCLAIVRCIACPLEEKAGGGSLKASFCFGEPVSLSPRRDNLTARLQGHGVGMTVCGGIRPRRHWQRPGGGGWALGDDMTAIVRGAVE